MAKGFLIGDIHLGAHSLQMDRWLNIMEDYFYNFLTPILKEQYQKGDKLFILGDLFDNRTYLELKVISKSLDIFNFLENLDIDLDIVIIGGNHDYYNDHDSANTSLRILEKHSNIEIHKEPFVYEIGTKKILLLPWIHPHTKQLEIIKEHTGKVDYLFCHSDLRGAKTGIKNVLKSGPTVADFVGYPKVYASHIHLYQTMENFTFLGSPYHLDRNDKGNKKGLTILDIETGEDIFIPNNLSPEFKTITITEESDIEHLDRLIKIDGVIEEKDNFIDLHINNSLIINKPEIRKKLEMVSKRKRISVKQFDDILIEDTVENIDLDDIGNDISVEDMIRTYVNNQQFDDILKEKIDELLEDAIKICKSDG